MNTMTKRDAVDAALTLAQDVADGKVSSADLERQALAELHRLVGDVVGPGDPVWPSQVEIARGVLALDGIPIDELSEWVAVAVAHQRAGEPAEPPEPDQVEPEPVSSANEDLSPEDVGAEAITAESDKSVDTTFDNGPQPSTGYDPLRGWQPGNSRRS